MYGNFVYHNAIENENAYGFNTSGIRLAITAGKAEIFNNVVYHTGGSGIYTDAETRAGDQIHIYGNTVSYCGQAGVAAYKTRGADGVGGVGYVYRNEISYCDRLAGQTGGAGNAACGIHFNDQAESGVDPARPFIKWYCYENHVHHCQAPASPRNEDSGGIALDFNANRVEVFRNLIHDNWGKGVYIYNADRCNVYGNILYANDSGITVSALSTGGETAHDNQIYNNTLYMNYNGDDYGPGYDCEILFGMNSHRVSIKNNILYAHPGGYAYYLFPGSSGLAVDRNCVYKDSGAPCYSSTQGGRTWLQWQALGFDLSGINVAPGFVNAAARDFRLAPSSPCIDNGTALPSPFDTAFSTNQAPFPYPTVGQGTAGAGWEMGAFTFIDGATLNGVEWIIPTGR
ncbi:right-handed parallel beta-helix repeat-containing protein [bacterium]|nr:right-handed parallel beta-helix repeat-containing protein [bacterium]